ncbi:MAG: hypothetical protein U0T81_04490 [Saprospiraceae bacterium]
MSLSLRLLTEDLGKAFKNKVFCWNTSHRHCQKHDPLQRFVELGEEVSE